MESCCNGKKNILYACSGACDLGEISDRVARKLRNEGIASMTCLAAIGGNVTTYIENAKAADQNIIIDGCKVECAKKHFEGIDARTKSFIISEMGYEKGKTPVTEEIIATVFETIKDDLS